MNLANEKYWHYEQCPTEHKDCPECQKKMITEWEPFVMMSSPPQRRWYWWCACGYTEMGGIHIKKAPSPRDDCRDDWAKINSK